MTRPSLCMIPPLFAYHVVNPRGSGAPAWSPTDITGLKLWIDFSDASTLFTDAGTTPVSSDGDAIYQANDKSGNSHNMTRGINSHNPLYKTNIKNSLSVAYLDGDQDFFTVNYSFPCTAETTIVVFLYKSDGPNFGRVFSQNESGTSDTSGTHYIPIYRSASDQFASYISNVRSPINTSADTWYMFQSIHTGSSLTNYLNETAGSAYTHTLNATWVTQRIGSNPLPGNYFKGYIGEVICYNSSLSGTNLDNIRTYLNDKWAVYEPAKAQSLEGLLDFEPEEEKLWWQGADVEAQAVEAVELTWLQKAKKWMDDKLYQLWQAIEDYFDYKEE